MQFTEKYKGFEIGPIRPPSEAESLLIRLTRNCPWNRCTFCPLYKNARFSIRPVDHVLRDIDTVRRCVDLIVKARSSGNSPDSADDDLHAMHAAYQFVAGGMQSIFIQDANSLILKPEDILCILKHLKQTFPMVERITSYARSQTIARVSDDCLRAMAEAGLNRIHIGMESGSDRVLKRVRKGTNKATQIVAGQKVKKAGMQLSEYYMPGLGGKSLSIENARETAHTLNQINPDYIRLRTLAMPEDAPLTKQYRDGTFDKMGEVDTAGELLLFLESLSGITSTVTSDHVLNLFQEIDGVLPGDREKMIQPVRDFLSLDREEQLLFCIGRRTHRIARLDGLHNPVQRRNTRQICTELGVTVENMDAVIDQITQGFI
ncbi:MAG: coproporphyrinogen III oxidase [Desulfobulbus propionicus]|nr:MAG: coproporphyrinogen III oxidase [Desulfobulbus propionicus]